MDYRSLGRTGVMVSPLCLGAMNFGGPTNAEDSVKIINRALDAGINFIDTANVYSNGESEKLVGRALKENGKRGQVVVATKLHNPIGEGPNDRGDSRYHIVRACEQSLRSLQTDRIDLYQLHRPPMQFPQDETLRAFDDLVHAGKVLYIGSSTFPAWMVMEALAISERQNLTRYISEQPPYNLLDRRIENELVPVCQKYGMAILPWSPLAGGILAGRYPLDGAYPEGSRGARTGAYFTDRISVKGRQVALQVEAMAKKRGLTVAQLSMLWVKDQPGITAPIIGPRTMEHLEQFLPVMDMALTDADRAAFDALVHPGNAVSDFHNSTDWMKARLVE